MDPTLPEYDPEGRTLASASPGEPSVGGALGPYPVEQALGEGGMGTVLRVTDRALGRTVAAKVVRGEVGAGQRTKFVVEARVTGQLEHPNIIPVHALGETEDGAPFFTMKEVRGIELAEAIRRHHEQAPGAPTRAELLTMFLKACDAVAFAHARGVVHRDLKPANIMVGEYGEVLVMDWGLAKVTGAADEAADSITIDRAVTGDVARTLDGAVVGTPAYMPPEQAEGAVDRIEARSDVYALGAILYTLLSGAAPYDGPTVWAVVAQVAEGALTPPSERCPGVPWELEAVVLRAMAHDQAARYADVGALQGDIEAWLAGERVGAARYTTWAALRNWAARNRYLLRGVAAVLATALVAGGLYAAELRRRAGAHATRVADAAARADATRAEHWIGAAKQATAGLSRDVLARPLPGGGELSHLGGLIERLRAASEKHDAVLALEREHPLRATQYRILLALGRVGEAAHEDALAAMAYSSASRLGLGERRSAIATRLRDRAAGAREARLARRATRTARALERARQGALIAESLTSAIIELSAFRDRQTLDHLVGVAGEIAASLDGVTRRLVASAARPDATERASGEEAIEGLGAALDAWLGAHTATDRLLPPEGPLAAALRRLVARARREGENVATWGVLLARAQDAKLVERGPGWEIEVRLVCDVLSRIGEPARVVAVLRHLAWADWEARRATPPAVALARLTHRAPAGGAWLLQLVGAGDRPGRYSGRNHLAMAITRALPTGVLERAHGDAAEEWRRAAGRASLLLGNRDLPRAKVAIARAMRAAPDEPLVLLVAGQVAWADRRREQAVALYGRALERRPTYYDAMLARGNALGRMGRLEAARDDLDAVVAGQPTIALGWAARAYVRNRQRDYPGALADADRALALDAGLHSAWNARGAALCGLGRRGEGRAAFERALQANSRSIKALMELAQLEIDAGSLAKAEDLVRRATAIEPDNAFVIGFRGIIRANRGDYRGALADLDVALARSQEGLFLLNRARVYGLLGMRKMALVDLDALIALVPRDARARRQRAHLRFDLRDLDGAHEDAETLIRLQPRHPHGYRLRGDVRVMRGDPRGALADLDRAVTLGPKDGTCWAARGHAYQRLRDYARARADYDKAVVVAPELWRAWMLRAGVRAITGDPSGGLGDLRRAIEVAPTRYEPRVFLGKMLAIAGDRAGAVASLREALKRAPASARPKIEAELRRLGG